MKTKQIKLTTIMSSVVISLLMGCQSVHDQATINQNKVTTVTNKAISQKKIIQQKHVFEPPVLQEEVTFDNPFKKDNINKEVPIPLEKKLQQYDWQLQNAVDSSEKEISVLTKYINSTNLHFVKNLMNNQSYNNVSFGVGCNNMGANYQLKNDKLTLETIISTQMYCEDKNQAESKLADIMAAESELFVNKNKLYQTTIDGSMLTWHGTLTEEAKYGKAETIFLEIAPNLEFCSSGINQKCLKVREVYYDKNHIKSKTNNWRLMKQQIEGYKHNTSYRTILRVKEFITNPVDIKGKQIKYVLDMEIEKELVN